MTNSLNFFLSKPKVIFVSRLDDITIEAKSLKWAETSQEVIRSLASNKTFFLTITGIGCHGYNQSTAQIEVKTETFSNGVIALADTNKINSTLGKFSQYTTVSFGYSNNNRINIGIFFLYAVVKFEKYFSFF